jgi:regulator of sigma E protease
LAILERLINYGTVALGLGFVIFIHELGHFLLAKWNGVKVEMFALGFGPALVSFRKGIGLRLGSTMRAYNVLLHAGREGIHPIDMSAVGETEYSIRAVPLGGFVKMLGEGDEANTHTVATSDPRAYPNKPVGARMAIISAGVLMNLLTGLLFFIWAYGRGGLPVIPAQIGGVVAGQPAYDAGLQAGDTVVAVDGRGDIDFVAMKRLTAMSGPGQVLRLKIRRKGLDEPLELAVEPRRQGDAEMKTMGILPPSDVTLAPIPFELPAGLSESNHPAGVLHDGDRLVAAGVAGEPLQPVSDHATLGDLMSRLRDRPLRIAVERANGGPKAEVTLPVVPMVDYGFRLTMGRVVALRPDSPASRAGFRAGDRIVRIEGLETVDPIRLPDELARLGGQEITVTVARAEAGKPDEDVTLTVTPTAAPGWDEPLVPDEALDVPALGLAYEVVPTIAEIVPGSPADRARLRVGETITGVTLTAPPIAGREAEKPLSRKLDGREASWPWILQLAQSRYKTDLKIAGRSTPVAITPEPVAGWYNPHRGLQFDALQRPLPPLGLVQAVRRGLDETSDTIQSVYAMFRNLFAGLISPKALGGPLMIADIASRSARSGLVSFLQFLGILSLNLAVINFLPVPPLDGGQMVFLLAEKLRGRPLPERAMNTGMIVGLVLVLGLMGFVLLQDFQRYFTG